MSGCKKEKNIAEFTTTDTVIIDNTFTTDAVNDKLWVNKTKSAANSNFDAATINLKENFYCNTDPTLVTFGKAYEHPTVLTYVPIFNKTNVMQHMIVDVGHNRADTLTAFLLLKGGGQAIVLGKLYRTIPLKERTIPIRSFALPFTIPPNERAILLLKSKRVTGVHEINVNLSTDKFFISKTSKDNFIRFSTFAITCFFVFAILSLGFIFKHGILIRLGIYTSTLALGQANFLYLMDDLALPAYLHLNGNTIGIFIIFMADCLIYPFSLAYIKSLGKYKKWHDIVVFILIALCTIPMFLILLSPLTPTINVLITKASLVLSTIGILWLFYTAVLGVIYKNESYLFVTVCLIFLPILYKTYIEDDAILNHAFFQSLYLVALLAYLTIALFRTELTSRELTSQKIKLQGDKLEGIRKTEIHHIGRNLHDDLGNTLASAIGYLNLNTPNVTVAKEMIMNAITEIRLLSHNLVKNDSRSLDEKLEELVDRFNNFSPILFEYKNFTLQKINQLPPLKQESIYMIVQEVLNNITKHSQAEEAVLQVFSAGKLIRFSIEDDGIGYDRTQKSSGIGLMNMQKRAQIANLTLRIDTGTGGTMVNIETALATDKN